MDPFKALFANTYLWRELIHMYVTGYVVSGSIVAGAYAFGRLRRNSPPPTRYQRIALTIPLTIAAVAAIAEGPVGDWAARDVAKTQLIKLAAIEGLYRTTPGAAEHVLGWYADDRVKYGIEIPHLLSLLAFTATTPRSRG
ncbi:MAG: cytochrome ubiquinol oxidase subunit I [Solirubrobacterales bacterium]|nr:cytochrome ubiquinol oxidase subunit I [Solirubrobacterales bacterium]